MHTSWNDPDAEFESAVHAWLDAVIDGPVAAELTALVARLDRTPAATASARSSLQLTAPGVPDVYQGTELWDDSLVDPDNRRPVDYARPARGADAVEPPQDPGGRGRAAAAPRPPGHLHRPAATRRCWPTGRRAEHLVAFLRGDDVLVAVSRWTVRLAETGWGDTVLALPDGDVDRPHRAVGRFSGRLAAADLFAELPVALLEREPDELNSRCGRRSPERVRLDVDGTLHPMTRSDDGWWRADVDARADARYGFVLDDDPTVLPDPRSPRQPDGVHERSQLWQPHPTRGPTATGRAGRSRAG